MLAPTLTLLQLMATLMATADFICLVCHVGVWWRCLIMCSGRGTSFSVRGCLISKASERSQGFEAVLKAQEASRTRRAGG